MNVIPKSIDYVKTRIPPLILAEAFTKNQYGYGFTAKTVDSQIMDLIIRPRVLVDCNLVGGLEVIINLTQSERERIDDITHVIRIPKSITNGQSILSVLHLLHMDPTKQTQYGLAGTLSGNAVLRLTQGVLDALAPLPTMSTATIELIAENTIMVKDNVLLPLSCFLRCVITQDTNMSKLRPRYYMQFCKLVELAVKAHIYNNLIVPLDEGYLKGGSELGIVKQIIEGYADAADMYDEFLVKWAKIMVLNDRESKTRHIRSMMSSNI